MGLVVEQQLRVAIWAFKLLGSGLVAIVGTWRVRVSLVIQQPKVKSPYRTPGAAAVIRWGHPKTRNPKALRTHMFKASGPKDHAIQGFWAILSLRVNPKTLNPKPCS